MIHDLLAFSRTGLANARAGAVNARISIALTLVNLPCGQFKSNDNSTLAVWTAEYRLAWGSLALCVIQLARAVPTTRYWQSEPRRRGSRAAAAIESAKQVHLELAGHLPVIIWSPTGCKPDLELSFRHYCFGAAAIRRCPLLAIDSLRLGAWGPQLAAKAGPGKGHYNNFNIRIEGLFQKWAENDRAINVTVPFSRW